MIVGENIHIRGSIEGDEDLVVRGRVEGSVRVTGAVTVEDGAWVAADIAAREVTVYGSVRGNISAVEQIEVTRSARIAGDAVAPNVIVEAGAAFRGRIEMGDPEALALESPPPRTPLLDRRAQPRDAHRAIPPVEEPRRPAQLPAPERVARETTTVRAAPVVDEDEPRAVPRMARPTRGPLRRRS
jgi:cytoskeletal protein CcmA (bactofilin family)